MKEYDVVIIGAGMAGMTSAIYLARGGFLVLVLESGAIGGQIVDSLKVENWPGEVSISGADLMGKVRKQVENLRIKIEYEKVEKVIKNNNGFRIIADENKYECRAVIIATGTEPRKLSDKQARDAGRRPISYCATCDGALYKDKPVVVVGSGNTAKHERKYLEKICSKVFHIHHDEPIPEEAEAVFVAIGRVPATNLVRDLIELDEAGYVVAGEDCRTSVPGVFVAGDVRTKDLRQLVTAAGDGAIAAAVVIDFLK